MKLISVHYKFTYLNFESPDKTGQYELQCFYTNVKNQKAWLLTFESTGRKAGKSGDRVRWPMLAIGAQTRIFCVKNVLVAWRRRRSEKKLKMKLTSESFARNCCATKSGSPHYSAKSPRTDLRQLDFSGDNSIKEHPVVKSFNSVTSNLPRSYNVTRELANRYSIANDRRIMTFWLPMKKKARKNWRGSSL